MHYKRKISLFFYFVLSFMYLELLLRIIIDSHIINVFSKGVLMNVLFIIPISLFFTMFSIFFTKRINFIIINLLIGLTSILYISQLIYFDVFSTFYNFYSLGNATAILEFWSGIISAISRNFFWIILMFLPFFLSITTLKKYFSFDKKNIRFIGTFFVLFLIFQLLSVFLINIQSKEKNSTYDLYYHTSSPVLSVEKLGLFTTMRLDLQRHLTEWSPTLSEPPKTIHIPKEDENEQEEIKNTPIEYNIMEIDFDKLIETENNETAKNMHIYFKNKQPTEKNEYTGKFKGYNLILITAEAFSPYAVHKEITPTLYKLVNEGYQFNDFYVPIWDVSTSDGEYVALNSLVPKPGVWSFSESGRNYVPFVLGNQLKELGYKTVGYHNHTYSYYDRHISHPNMGYEYKGIGNGLNVKETWTASDLEMMKKTVHEYINDEPFHAYYMTVSGHLEYNFFGQEMALKNKKYVDHLELSNQAKAYLATQIELDKALEYLLSELKKANVIDKTLIVLSSDHYPYGLEFETINEFEGREVDRTFEIYKNNLIIYAEGMEKTVINEPTSSLDILPTVLNLMGITYDSRLLMGRDIFSNEEPIVVFRDGSFITDKGRYDAINGKFIPKENIETPENHIETLKNKANEIFYYSSKILETDYYRKIFPNQKHNNQP